MPIEFLLIGLGAAALLSYWFLHLGRLLRLPSVVFLLAAGLLARQLLPQWPPSAWLPPAVLPLVGTIGLILIVLEGALDLELRRGERTFLARTFTAAAVGVTLTTGVLAALFHLTFDLAWPRAALLAIPFAVISSAVAIPSSEGLGHREREFVVYESSWSDILGVMLFNAAAVAVASGTSGEFWTSLLAGGAAVALIGTLIGVAMYWLVGHLEGHVKFVPLISALLLVYGVAKVLHLSPLLIVLVLGLILNNPRLIGRIRWFDRLHSRHYHAELGKLKHLTAEATFLVRTVFFLLLGYSTDVATLGSATAWAAALGIVALVLALRWPVLRLVGVQSTRPLLWLAPRGLITVLLFYSLPEGTIPAGFGDGTLILVVLLSCVVLAAGVRMDARERPPAAATP